MINIALEVGHGCSSLGAGPRSRVDGCCAGRRAGCGTSGDGQTITKSRQPGEKAKFEFRFRNAGLLSDDIRLFSCGGGGYFKAKFFVDGKNITTKVVAENQVFHDLAHNASTPVVLVKVKVADDAPPGASSGQECLAGNSDGDPARWRPS